MKNKLRKSITIITVIIICLTFFYQNAEKTYASSDKYLVLIQQKNGSWKEYKSLIEKSGSGTLMIKAKLISKALGFTYKNYSDTFVIKRSASRYNTYTKSKKDYTYTNEAVNYKKLAPYIAYTSKNSKYNLCQVSTLDSMVNYKFFSNPDSKDYSDYSGVICYSKYKEIPASIPKSDPTPTKKPAPTPTPIPTPVPEPTKISVEGVDFPVRKSFLTVDKALSDWGGTAAIWYELERKVDSKIIESTNLIIGVDKIEFTHLAAGSNGISLLKASKGYKISIGVKLSGSVLANQNAEILKAMVATISSKPTLVYTAIYESFTSDETHGINDEKYVAIGDCRIKVEVKGGVVTYLILEA